MPELSIPFESRMPNKNKGGSLLVRWELDMPPSTQRGFPMGWYRRVLDSLKVAVPFLNVS